MLRLVCHESIHAFDALVELLLVVEQLGQVLLRALDLGDVLELQRCIALLLQRINLLVQRALRNATKATSSAQQSRKTSHSVPRALSSGVA